MAKQDSQSFLAVILVLCGVTTAFAGAASSPEDRVWITRPDGSLQCDAKAGASAPDPVAAAQSELEKTGVHVIDAKKRNDGKIRAQMCGISTGNQTSFLIPKAEFSKAKAIGFDLVH